MKKQGKAEKASCSTTPAAGGAPTSPPPSNASTATSTPKLAAARSPEPSNAGAALPADPGLRLPEGALEVVKSGTAGACAVCGVQAQEAATGPVHLYCCENPHHEHSFLSCSDRCAKKFAKECSRPSEARRKQLVTGKRNAAGLLSCPRCHFPLVVDRVSPAKTATGGASEQCAEPQAGAFVPAGLLPAGGGGERRLRARPPPVQQAALDEAEEEATRQPRDAQRQAELVASLLDEQEAHTGGELEEAREREELEEARRIVAATGKQLAEFEERLAQLSGQKHRKERNELNQRIVALKNHPDVLAAERLVRDPAAEYRRREREARAREAEAAKNAKVQDVVRCRLVEAVEQSGLPGEQVCEELWVQLLREGRSTGLAEEEEAMQAVQAKLDALREEERAREERRKTQEAVQAYAQRLERRAFSQWRGGGRAEHSGSGGATWQRWSGGSGRGRGTWASSAGGWDRRGRGRGGGNWAATVGQAYKTQLCYCFELDSCPYGNRCTFAHGIQELRPRSWRAEESAPRQEEQRWGQWQRWPQAPAPRAEFAEQLPRVPEAGDCPAGEQRRGAERAADAPGTGGPEEACLRGLRLPPPPPPPGIYLPVGQGPEAVWQVPPMP